MPQTKQQRRESAIARFRANYEERLKRYKAHQKLGKAFLELKKTYNEDYAEERAKEEQLRWNRYLVNAALAADGTPLNAEQWRQAKEDLRNPPKEKKAKKSKDAGEGDAQMEQVPA